MKSDEKALSRRRFIQASLAGSAALAGAPLARAKLATESLTVAQATTDAAPGAGPSSQQGPLPTRRLGRTAAHVSILSLGGMMPAIEPPAGAAGNPFLDVAWGMGCRYFDTADCYLPKAGVGQSEKYIGDWLQLHPDYRKQMFLVTKDHPKTPGDLLAMIDKRLERLRTDYVDLFLIHGMSKEYGGDQSFDWLRGGELKEVAEKLKKSGKIKFFGFSCHDSQITGYLQAAAEGGFIDAIMIKYAPFMKTPDEFNRAMDACIKQDIGLVAMKVNRTVPPDLPKRIPEFDRLGMNTRQAILHATWSDERITAVCSNIENLQQMAENTQAARLYKQPLKSGEIERLAQLVNECGPAFCPNCDGRCQRAAGTHVALNTISRYVSYYEMDGRLDARELYWSLPQEMRQIDRADLAAAEEACLCKLNFAKILAKAERYFA